MGKFFWSLSVCAYSTRYYAHVGLMNHRALGFFLGNRCDV